MTILDQSMNVGIDYIDITHADIQDARKLTIELSNVKISAASALFLLGFDSGGLISANGKYWYQSIGTDRSTVFKGKPNIDSNDDNVDQMTNQIKLTDAGVKASVDWFGGFIHIINPSTIGSPKHVEWAVSGYNDNTRPCTDRGAGTILTSGKLTGYRLFLGSGKNFIGGQLVTRCE